MMISPSEIIITTTLLAIPVLVTRIIVGLTYPRRTHKIWTFLIPTGTLLIFMIRVSITRNLNSVDANDWVSAASYTQLVLGQVAAIIYQWAPEVLVERIAIWKRR